MAARCCCLNGALNPARRRGWEGCTRRSGVIAVSPWHWWQHACTHSPPVSQCAVAYRAIRGRLRLFELGFRLEVGNTQNPRVCVCVGMQLTVGGRQRGQRTARQLGRLPYGSMRAAQSTAAEQPSPPPGAHPHAYSLSGWNSWCRSSSDSSRTPTHKRAAWVPSVVAASGGCHERRSRRISLYVTGVRTDPCTGFHTSPYICRASACSHRMVCRGVVASLSPAPLSFVSP